jgi:hypothetical protein
MAYHGEVDPEIKARALTLARAVGAYQAAKQCGLVFTTVQRWVREDDAAAAGIPKPPPKPRGRKSRASAMGDAATVPPPARAGRPSEDRDHTRGASGGRHRDPRDLGVPSTNGQVAPIGRRSGALRRGRGCVTSSHHARRGQHADRHRA